MKKILSLAAAAVLTMAACAQTQVTTYQPGATAEGVTYFMPLTTIHVTVKATRTLHEPGEYAQYAERFLRLKNAPTQTYDEWQINEVTLSTYGRADRDKAYSIKLRQKSTAANVSLAPDGRLLAINTPTQLSENISHSAVGPLETVKKNPDDYKTEEILAAGSTVKMAEIAANEIYDIRENRAALAKGQADFMPKDGEQLRIMMDNLQQSEEGLLMLFKGTSRKQEHTFTFDFTPSGEVQNELLFRFSKYYGCVDKDDLSGAPVYISVKDLRTVPEAVAEDNKKEQKHETDDVRYIVPSRANVSIATESTPLAHQVFPIAQFGHVEYLGAELFNKKQMTAVTFSPETGSVVQIKPAEQK